jgi:hypothetical protein
LGSGEIFYPLPRDLRLLVLTKRPHEKKTERMEALRNGRKRKTVMKQVS